MERLRRALKPPGDAGTRPLRTLEGTHDGPEKNFDLKLFQIAVLEFHHLIEPLLANRSLGLLKSFVLTLDNCPAY